MKRLTNFWLVALITLLIAGVVWAGDVSAQSATTTATPTATEEKEETSTADDDGWFFGWFGRWGMGRDGWFHGRLGDWQMQRGNHGRGLMDGRNMGRGGWFNGPMGPNNRMGGRMGGRGMGSAGLLMNGLFQQERLAVLAQALGMSADELQKALTAGQTPHQLAEAKGMTVEAFQAALQTAAEAHLQQAVKDGRITQAQADALRQRVTEIDPFLGGRNGRGPASIPMLGALRGEMPTIMAETLGMTVDELTTARQQGKTIGELAEEKGLDTTELRTAFLKVLDTHLKEAVSAGKLTQAQADAIRQQMAEHDFVGRGRW